MVDSKLERDDWRKALAADAIRAELRAAYLDLPTPIGDRLRAWSEREPEPDPEVRLLA